MLALFLLNVFLVWIFSWRDFIQVTGTDANCVLERSCSQFITFEQVTLCSAYCAWFVALSASRYAVLFCTCPYLFLAQFDNSVWVVLTSAKLALRTVIMSFHRWLSLLLRLKVIASIEYLVYYLSGASLTCSVLACRLLGVLVCITRPHASTYNFEQASIY